MSRLPKLSDSYTIFRGVSLLSEGEMFKENLTKRKCSQIFIFVTFMYLSILLRSLTSSNATDRFLDFHIFLKKNFAHLLSKWKVSELIGIFKPNFIFFLKIRLSKEGPRFFLCAKSTFRKSLFCANFLRDLHHRYFAEVCAIALSSFLFGYSRHDGAITWKNARVPAHENDSN